MCTYMRVVFCCCFWQCRLWFISSFHLTLVL